MRFGLPTSPLRLGRDGRRLEPQPGFANRRGGLVDDAVLRLAPRGEREVEARQLELEPDHVRGENAQRFLEQLLAGLVALEHDDRAGLHRGASVAPGARLRVEM